MSDTARSTARFIHDPPPLNPEEIPSYLGDIFEGLASLVNSPTRNFAPMNKEPPKPAEGDMAYANGSAEGWDPGSGRGLYIFTGGEWILISGGGLTPVGGIIMWSGTTAPDHWAICDGVDAPNGMATPDLKDQSHAYIMRYE